MTPRKTPYRHEVSPHIRAGKPIGSYERGKGKKPNQSNTAPRVVGKSGSSYIVTLSGGGVSETYRCSGSPVSALKEAVGKIQKPFVPTKATLRRVS